ncbi:class I tRNA ligase family protein [Candidatus Woesearchaeota archaeon]|nr:class I tRNA ligase family protein [Candidatus Woesearchaeota archaeon]
MINFKEIEQKWQKKWEQAEIFHVKEDKNKKKYFCLEMYPYPSSSGLHMGHALNYSIGDIYSRFKRMNSYNVLYPMGFDSFGLPAENAAIKNKSHPKIFTENAINNYIKQMKELGLSYDWSRTLMSHDPNYYKWNQYFFLKFLEKGLAYRKKARVNWCPDCKTVLANEQVHEGKCWRHKETNAQIKQLEQWFFKTTEYAEELLNDIEKLDWPERIKIMQRNWIGKSYGTEVMFKINNENWKVFTTRPDTLFGVTFMVISAQHEKLMTIVTKEQKKQVEDFLKKVKSTKQEDMDKLEKEGVFTGAYAEHPLTKEKIPVYTGNFIIAEYGSGMVMAVPAHDKRDFDFAKKYKLPIKEVVQPLIIKKDGEDAVRNNLPFKQRDAVVCVVKHWSENKYLCLKWKQVSWNGFIVGGIEKGEDTISASKREIIEETGYKHVKFVKKLGNIINSQFYHKLKKENRWAHFQGLYFELEDSKKDEISDEEKKIHDITWVEKENVGSFLNADDDMKIIWERVFHENAYENSGILINSKEFNGLKSEEAKEKIAKFLESKKLGKKSVQYKLRDWLISRQRYWGTPIPIIYCDKCNIVPVPEKDIPVLLPEDIKFGEGNPLETSQKFVNVKCPKCNSDARRETDTMDTFVDSSWYYLRYTDNKNNKKPFDKEKAQYWMPVNQYIGGAEHAVMHLIYARFFTKVLRDLGYIHIDEPFPKLFNQGMLHKDGFVMSKSRGNVILPEAVSKQYGIDTARLFLVSIASPDKDTEWSDKGVEGSLRFINKIFDYFDNVKFGKTSKIFESKLHKTIKEVADSIEAFKYNIAIIKIRELFESREEEINKKDLEIFVKLLAPFCPHITEELWQRLGNKTLISLEKWPISDSKKINERLEEEQKNADRLIDDIKNIIKILMDKGKEIQKIYVYVLPKELEFYNKGYIEKKVEKKVEIYSVADKKKYDPENKSTKAKPGKPAVYVE